MKFLLWTVFLLAPVDPAALSDRAQQAAAAKRFEEAEKLWREALAASPEFFPALFNLGYMQYSRGRYSEAESWLAAAVRVNPQDFNARYLLGTVLTKLDRREEALRQWRA